MVDYLIFGFGLVVTLVVGSGLVGMVVVHNRAENRASSDKSVAGPVPVRVRKRD